MASWWPLVSPVADYEEEARFYSRLLEPSVPGLTMVEFGSGGGSNAHYLKHSFSLTLVDPSVGMLDVSRALNPECEHILGDMRTARLGRVFDRVFIHDAIDYMTTLHQLRQAVETAYIHCAPGGLAVFAPDALRENYSPGSECGGSDGEGRGLRYLEWHQPVEPGSSICVTDYVFVLREQDGGLRVEHDRHESGLFSRAEWLDVLTAAGFLPEVLPLEHSEVEPGTVEVFVARRPFE